LERARCLLALARGEETPHGLAGGLMLSNGLQDLAAVAALARGLSK